MKQFNKLLAICLPAIAPTFAYDVRISTFDTDTPSLSSDEGRASSDTAELILARRLGRPESGVVGQVDEQVLQDLNKFGGRQPDLFGSASDEKLGRLLLVLEGADNVDASVTEGKSTGDIVVPQAAQNLIPSFDTLYGSTRQEDPLSRQCSYEWETNDGFGGRLIFSQPDGASCPSREDFLAGVESHTDGTTLLRLLSREPLLSVTRPMPAQLNLYSKTHSEMEKDDVAGILSVLRTLSSESQLETTAVLLPSGYHYERHSKNDTTTHDSHHASIHHHLQTSPSSPERSRRSPNDDPPQTAPRNLSTLMPICHASNSSCNDATKHCSGHGFCYKRHSANSKGDSESGGDCYACKCNRTVIRTNDDGTVKTVQWGGPACQKKDVSMPFWLLGGFTVLFAGIIAAGIGMMYSIGQEELPSVLSAGVSAPKK